ncbi:MAG: hypothetical protein WBN83_00295 [Desulfoprunum sp.]|jgi:hypothetical protein|uniref:hypothetical protein n=1 Tax=Desulfoprunum sp. TaxID=2020866 RepID=UPI00052E10D4|nr:hypothetical protein JT06_07735 [Desulfobulbus sp. Tol-SR]
MKSSHLIVMPLLALVFILFLYWLAVQNAPPKSMRKTPIAIAALEIVAADDSKTRELVLAGRFDRSSASAATTGTDDSVRKVTNLETAMYNAKPFVTEQDTFLPSDRIYIVLELHDLDKGQHRLSASWIDPEGKTINTSEHTILLDAPELTHRSYFWLELMKNGPFTELVTGREFKGNVYGRWQVQIHLNGHPVDKREFSIQDT